jgi:hypothetical protein
LATKNGNNHFLVSVKVLKLFVHEFTPYNL